MKQAGIWIDTDTGGRNPIKLKGEGKNGNTCRSLLGEFDEKSQIVTQRGSKDARGDRALVWDSRDMGLIPLTHRFPL